MQGMPRRIVYVTFYELIAIALSTVAMQLVTSADLVSASSLAVVASVIAILWNLAYNALFEAWEARQAVRGRSLRRRIAHAIGFEAGFVVTLVPLFAWWLGISLLEALVLDAGMIVLFLVYTFLYNLAFDTVFGLPAAAR